jgi:hypothetical protein
MRLSGAVPDPLLLRKYVSKTVAEDSMEEKEEREKEEEE